MLFPPSAVPGFEARIENVIISHSLTLSLLVVARNQRRAAINTYFPCRICKGFNDAEGTREFLFALPRFARDEVEDDLY